MKKTFRLLFIICVIACGVFSLIACKGPALNTPMDLRFTEDQRTLYWTSVSGANSYLVEVNGIEYPAERNSFDVSQLTPDVEYTFRVKAIGDRLNFSDSKWSSSVKMMVETQSGLSYKAVEGNTAYEISGIGVATGDITVEPTFRGKPVVGVGASAFYNCNYITSITLPDSITYINDRAFQNCTEMLSINYLDSKGNVVRNSIPDTVTTIGKNVFRNCTKLTSIIIPDSVTSINENAFAYCSALASIQISKSISTIPTGCFRNCPLIESVVIPGNVGIVSDLAFTACSGLKTVKLEDGVTIISNDTFGDCASLASVDFGNTLTMIGSNCFRRCSALTEAILPDSLELIAAYAFRDCTALKTVKFGTDSEHSKLSTVYQYVFQDTALSKAAEDAKESFVYADGWVLQATDYMTNITKTDLPEGEEQDPEAHDPIKTVVLPKETVGIATGAFATGNNPLAFICYEDENGKMTIENGELKEANGSVTGDGKKYTDGLPDSVKYINPMAFSSCAFVTFTLGKNVESIGASSFSQCKSLEELKINGNEKLKNIDEYAFYATRLGCTHGDGEAPGHFTFPASLERVGQGAFEDSYYYTWYAKNGEVVYVGGWVVGVTNQEIAAVNIQPSIADIDKGLVDGNYPKITTVGIAEYAFYKCGSVQSIDVPKDVKHIGRCAFMACTNLIVVSLPDTLTEIEEYTFYASGVIAVGVANPLTQRMDFPSSLTKIGRGAFYGCGMFDNQGWGITIPASVETIEPFAFANCPCLSGLKFAAGSKLTRIGEAAFYKTMTEVDMSGNIHYIDVNIPDTVTEIGDYAFYSCTYLRSVNFGKGVQRIGSYAFDLCVQLSELQLPASLTEIGDYAFKDCASLASIEGGENLKSIGKAAFRSCIALESFTMPDNLETIGDQAFRDCTGLEQVMLKDGVEDMGLHIFYGCRDLTVYSELADLPEDYGMLWNTSYCPVVFGCTMSEDGSYVESMVKGKIYNIYSRSQITAPVREGYVFDCWTDENGNKYSAEQLSEVADGTKLNAVWKSATAVPETPEQPAPENPEAN